MTLPPSPDVLVTAASNGVNLQLQLPHLGARVVGRQLVSSSTHPGNDNSIADQIQRLDHLRTLQP